MLIIVSSAVAEKRRDALCDGQWTCVQAAQVSLYKYHNTSATSYYTLSTLTPQILTVNDLVQIYI